MRNDGFSNIKANTLPFQVPHYPGSSVKAERAAAAEKDGVDPVHSVGRP